MTIPKRGKNVAIVASVFQATLAGVMLFLWQWTGSLAAMATTVFAVGGLFAWLLVAFLFYCRQLARREELELAELAEAAAVAGRIFEADEAGMTPAANRLRFVERWVVPVFTAAWAVYHVAMAIVLLRVLSNKTAGALERTAEGALFAVMVGFVGFLLSRYTIGMSRGSGWRLLRAPGSYLLVNVLAVVGVVAALLAAYQKYPVLDKVLAMLVPAAMIVFAVEIALNLVLDIYRPRLPGQEQRPSFDSRLFNLVAEPERVGHSLAEALNYQFGFEVSGTWFYRLLERAMAPLVVFGVLVLLAMTSLVLVHDGEQAVILKWGKADAQRAVLEPGLRFKLPWPVEVAVKTKVAKVNEVMLGLGGESATAVDEAGRKVVVWTEPHSQYNREEKDFLIAIPPPEGGSFASAGETPPPVNIIKLVMAVHYRVNDVYDYNYRFVNPDKMIECLAYREMTAYCASATLDDPIPGNAENRPEAIMTYGRGKAADAVKQRVQKAIDELQLGVVVTDVLITAAHPPAEAAEAFEQVVQAEIAIDEMRYKAEGEANNVLAKVAGTESAALQMALAIRRMGELSELQRLSDNQPALRTKLTELLSVARQDVERLSVEIGREKLLGKIRDGEPAPLVELRETHVRYVNLLEKVAATAAAGETIDVEADVIAARTEADTLLAQAAGAPAVLVANADAQRWRVEMTERARAEAFHRELLAYNAAPNIYMLDRWLDVWDEVLPDITKYVLGVDRSKVELWLNTERDSGGFERVTFDPKDAGK